MVAGINTGTLTQADTAVLLMAQAKSHHPPLAISKDIVLGSLFGERSCVPGPLISQFISGVMDGLDLPVGKH